MRKPGPLESSEMGIRRFPFATADAELQTPPLHLELQERVPEICMESWHVLRQALAAEAWGQGWGKSGCLRAKGQGLRLQL